MKVLNFNSKRKLSFSDSLIISVFIIFTAFGSSAQIAVNTDGSSADASAMIDIKSTAKGFLGPRMTEAQKNAISSPATGLLVYQTDGIPGYYYYTGSSWTKFGTGTGSSQWTTSGNDIYYTTGNVGVATDSPGAKLHIGSADGDAAIKINNKAILEFGVGLTKETNAGKIGYEAFTSGALDIVGGGTTASNRKVQFHAEGGTTFSGGVGIKIAPDSHAGLFVRGGDANTEQTPPLFLHNSNQETSTYWKVGPNRSNSFIIYNQDNTGVYISGTSWAGSSDIRLKENIIPVAGALKGILSLRGVKYNFTGKEKTEIGVIAQEVQVQFPELVSENDGYLGVAYDRLGPILIEAIKEQQKQIEALKQEIEILKNK